MNSEEAAAQKQFQKKPQRFRWRRLPCSVATKTPSATLPAARTASPPARNAKRCCGSPAACPCSLTPITLRCLASPPCLAAGCSYVFARWNPLGLWLATVCLAVNWFGDSLDGTLARFRNRRRPRYGFYVDHMIDSFGALFLMAGLGASGYVDWRIAAGMLVAFLLCRSKLPGFVHLGNLSLVVRKMDHRDSHPSRYRQCCIIFSSGRASPCVVQLLPPTRSRRRRRHNCHGGDGRGGVHQPHSQPVSPGNSASTVSTTCPKYLG